MNNDLFRRVETEKPDQSKRYESLGFTRNPFPRHPGVIMNDPDNRQNGSIYLRELRKDEEKKFEKILIPTADRRETKTIGFLMDYATRKGRGIGKTAFLNYQKGRIMKDFGSKLSGNSEILFAVYVAPNPNDNYRKFWSISKLIIDALIEQEILSSALCRLRVFTGLIDDKVVSKAGSQLNETIGNDNWLNDQYKELKENDPEFNSQLDIHEVNQAVRLMLSDLKIEEDLCRKLAIFGYDSSNIYRYYYDRQPELFWKKNADKILFTDIVKIMELSGFTHGIVLFEELEKIIVPHTSSARREFCEALRYYLIDGSDSYNTSISFFKFLLTVHPYLQELLYPHWHASGLGRFAGLSEEISDDFTVYFNPIEKPSAVPLATAYLIESRLKKEPGIKPFTKEALSYALTKTLGVPGKYLAFLHSVVEHAIINGWNTIDVVEIKTLESQVDTPPEADPGENEKLGDTKVDLR